MPAKSAADRHGKAVSMRRRHTSEREQLDLFRSLPGDLAPRDAQDLMAYLYVRPGGDILLRLAGWPKVERVLQIVDAVEALGIDPADVAPDYWHHVHSRLSVNEAPRPYTRSRHQAWLHRRRIVP